MKNWEQHFPYDKARDQQKKAIEFILKSFEEGKKYAIVECGTGVGKSAIGFTIAKSLNEKLSSTEKECGAYFLTTQKVLQDQYFKDFGSLGMISLRSSSNYTCNKSKDSCKEILTQIRSGNNDKNYDSCNYDCKYKKTKQQFSESKVGITNFSYFLTEKNYSKKLPDKTVLIIDEAHNLENELTKFIEISVSEYFCNKILNIKFENYEKELNTQFKVFKFINDVYIKKIVQKINHIEKTISNFGPTFNLDKFKKISRQIDILKSHKNKILQFIQLYDKDNWVFDISSEGKYKKFIFKPIDISHYSKQYLLNFADYIVFMSATIVSHEGFIETIGLDKEKTVSIKEKSPFPSENRPIVYSPSGSMSSKKIDVTLPIMCNMIKSVLENHKNEKGIIHTHNTRIALYLKEKIKDRRLILAYGANREKYLNKHINSKYPTVLISPSMSEGVDLKGDLSSFQILCKVPYPYLGDKVTRKKMNKWKWWYNTQTVRTIIQSVGRSIRSENDKAVTYIFDADWKRIKSNCKDYFPAGFFENYHEY